MDLIFIDGGKSYREAKSDLENARMLMHERTAVFVVGGHAVVAVGYDDNMKIKNTNPGDVETTGAFLIRNSWGTRWGDGGYGWLPYDYVLRRLAVDWWSLLKNEWIDTGTFGR